MRVSGPVLPPLKHHTLGEALESAASSGARGLTFIDAREDEVAVPWHVLLERSRRVAAGLVERGVEAGDRVAIVLPTSPEFCEAFFGAVLAGAVPVPLYPPVRLGRMDEYHAATARMLSVSGARCVVSGGALRLLLGGTVAQVAAREGRQLEVETVEALSSKNALDLKFPRPRRADDLALIQFSSGSTVDPKPVALTHHNVLAQCAALKALMPEEGIHPSAGVSWLPLYHDMGLIGALLTAVTWPGPLALLPPEVFLARPSLWLRAISRHRATVSPAPNFAYGLCLKRVKDEELEGVDLSSLRYATNGAEPISVEVLRRFAERFSRFGFDRAALRPVYGLSEATLAVTWTKPQAEPKTAVVDPERLARESLAVPARANEAVREIVSVGVPVPGAEVEVRSALGLPIEEGQVGRIHVRGDSVMPGYFDQAEATARVKDAAGWLDTGDLGFWRDGELYVCGRGKDVVIIRGANHSPSEFEECAAEVPGVRTGCVVAVGFMPSVNAEGDTGEVLLLLVERASARAAEREDAALATRVSAEVLKRTGIRPWSVEVLAPGTLPRTSSGKLRRGEALRQYAAGTLRPPAKAGTLKLLGEVVRSVVAQERARAETSGREV